MTATRSHLAAAQSDPLLNRSFSRRWSPNRWEYEDLEERARRADRRGDIPLARELAMRALRIRVAEASR